MNTTYTTSKFKYKKMPSRKTRYTSRIIDFNGYHNMIRYSRKISSYSELKLVKKIDKHKDQIINFDE